MPIDRIELRTLAVASLCPWCSFTFLDDLIPLGTEYMTYPDAPSVLYSVGCGGCGRIFDPGPTVLASSVNRPADIPRSLPVALFRTDHTERKQ